MQVLIDVDDMGMCWCRVLSIPDTVRAQLVHTVSAHGWEVRPVFDGRGGWPVDAILGVRHQQQGESTRELVSACLVLHDALMDLGADHAEFGNRLECLARSYIPRPTRQGPSC